VLELGRIDLFIFSSNVKSSDAKSLEILLFKVRLLSQELVNDAHTNIEGFGPKFEFEMELREPVNEVSTHLFGDFALVLHKFLWI
jgi:hypothetical protein